MTTFLQHPPPPLPHFAYGNRSEWQHFLSELTSIKVPYCIFYGIGTSGPAVTTGVEKLGFEMNIFVIVEHFMMMLGCLKFICFLISEKIGGFSKPVFAWEGWKEQRGNAQSFFLAHKSNQNTWFSATLVFSLRGYAQSFYLAQKIQPKYLVFCFLGFLPGFSLVFCFLPHPMQSHF